MNTSKLVAERDIRLPHDSKAEAVQFDGESVTDISTSIGISTVANDDMISELFD